MEKHKKILVVDDEPDSLMTLSMALKSLGYVVLGALNGKEGLKLFKEEKPDLVILELSCLLWTDGKC